MITSEAAVRHGTSKWYYRNERSFSTYNQGELNGESIEYDHLGNVKSRSEYLNGNKNGEQYYYYLDGTLALAGMNRECCLMRTISQKWKA